MERGIGAWLRKKTGVQVSRLAAKDVVPQEEFQPEKRPVNAIESRVHQLRESGRMKDETFVGETFPEGRVVSRATLKGLTEGEPSVFNNDRVMVSLMPDGRIFFFVADGVDSFGDKGGKLARRLIDACRESRQVSWDAVRAGVGNFIKHFDIQVSSATTLSAVEISSSGLIDKAIHAGDTRLYIYSGRSGKIERLTPIQNRAGERADRLIWEREGLGTMTAMGIAKGEGKRASQLEAAIIVNEGEVEYKNVKHWSGKVQLERGDIFLGLSDGVKFGRRELGKIIQRVMKEGKLSQLAQIIVAENSLLEDPTSSRVDAATVGAIVW